MSWGWNVIISKHTVLIAIVIVFKILIMSRVFKLPPANYIKSTYKGLR